MLTLCTVVERMVLYGPGDRHFSRIHNHRCQVPWELKQNWMQGWQYGKGLIYLRPTKLALLRARATVKGNTMTALWGCSALGVQFVGNSQKGELNRKTNKQKTTRRKNGKRLLFSTFYSLNAWNRPHWRHLQALTTWKIGLRKRRGNYALRAKRQKKIADWNLST